MSEKDAPTKSASNSSDSTLREASDHSSEPDSDRSQGDAPALSNGQESDQPDHRAEADPPDNQNAAPKAPGHGLSVFALIVALLALAGVGWLYFEGQEQSQSGLDQDSQAIGNLRDDLRDELNALREQVSALGADQERVENTLSESNQAVSERIDAVARQQNQLAQRLDDSVAARSEDEQIDSTLSQQRDALQSLEGRIVAVEQSQDDLTGTLTGIESRLAGIRESVEDRQGVRREIDRDLVLKLDLLETATLVSIGQARIELASDKDAALAAYEQASRRLAQTSDQRLNQAADQLAEEMALIESWSRPDWTRFAARLGRWETEVAEWPLRLEPGSASAPGAAVDEEQGSGWLSDVRQSLGQLVTVERLDGLDLDEAMIVAIQERLQLHLAAAGLAVQRRDIEALQLRLDHVLALLDDFFLVDREPMVSIRSELETMAGIQAPVPLEGLGQAAAALDRVIETL